MGAWKRDGKDNKCDRNLAMQVKSLKMKRRC
jgi:hypothetical protein